MAKSCCSLCGDKCDCDKDIRVYFCPKCRSHNVRYTFGLGNLFGVVPRQKCLDCDYSSATFPLIVTSKNKIKKTVAFMKKKAVKKKIKKGGKK
jgi:hypothetical protein